MDSQQETPVCSRKFPKPSSGGCEASLFPPQWAALLLSKKEGIFQSSTPSSLPLFLRSGAEHTCRSCKDPPAMSAAPGRLSPMSWLCSFSAWRFLIASQPRSWILGMCFDSSRGQAWLDWEMVHNDLWVTSKGATLITLLGGQSLISGCWNPGPFISPRFCGIYTY